MKRYLFIHNPAAKRFRSHSDFRKLKEIANREIEHADFVVSTSQGSIGDIIRQKASGFDIVVACGGDGTVREAAIATIEMDICLGIIPMGSGNDFSKSLKIPMNTDKAITLLKQGNVSKVDVGFCNDILFLNTLGFGFDGHTNLLASQSRLYNGTLRYLLAALIANFNRDVYDAKISLAGHKMISKTVMMVTAANGRVEGGNFRVAPEASLTDGKLDFVILEPISQWLLPLQLPMFLNGSHLLLKKVQTYQAEKGSISFNKPVYIHADGEVIHSEETEFNIKVKPSRLSVISGLYQ